MNLRPCLISIFVYCLAVGRVEAARNVTISSAPTSGGSFAGGVFTPTADNAVVAVLTITNLLNAGTSVIINTGSTGSQVGVIMVNAPITQLNSSSSSLTLNAQDTVSVNSVINLGTGGGNFTITTSGQILQNAPIFVSGTASFSTGASPITLALNNVFSGTVTFGSTGADSILLVNNGPLVLGTSIVGKDLIVSAVGPITQTGPLTIAGTAFFLSGDNPITLNNVANAFTGAVTFTNNGANDIAVANNRTLTLGTSTAGGNLTATANGAITETGLLTVSGTSTFSAGAHAITLTQANQFAGTVSLSNTGANDVALTENRALLLDASTIGRNLSISAAGAITQTNALTVAGTTFLSAGANPITLDNSNNILIGAVSFATSGANDVLVANGRSLVLGTSTLPHNFTALADGEINQAGILTVTGTSSFSASSNINLTLANQLTGSVRLNNTGPSNITLTNNRALLLGSSTTDGNLAVTAAGVISQNGALIVGGTSSFIAPTNIITLTQSNQFFGPVTVSNSGPNDVILNRITPLILSASTIGRNFNVGPPGAISQVGPLAVGGTAFFSAGSNTVTLDNATNAFTGAVAFSTLGSNDVVIVNNQALSLGVSAIGGNFTATAAGVITQVGALTSKGSSSFSAGAHSIILTLANQFTGSVTLNNSGPNNASLAVNQPVPLTLAASSIGQNLVVSVNTAITQTGPLSVGGTAAFTASAHPITLNESNLFSGRVFFNNSGANDASIANATTLALGTSAFGGNFTAAAPAIQLFGNLTAAGTLTLAGPTSVDATSQLHGLGVNLPGDLTGNGNTLTVIGPAILSGGTLDAANSHFTFQDSFTMGTNFLHIQNWNGAPAGGGASQIIAGSSASGLPVAQLMKVVFVNPAGFSSNLTGATILSTGEIVPAAGPFLQFALNGTDFVLTWPDPAILQSSTNVTGPYLDVPSATSPYTNTPGDEPSQFFRLR